MMVRAEGRPGKQNALCGIGLAVDRVERAVKDGVTAEELAIVDLVAVQTQRGTDGNNRPARWEKRSRYQRNAILQWDDRPGKDYLEDDDGREQAVSGVVIRRDGGDGQAEQHASDRCQG